MPSPKRALFSLNLDSDAYQRVDEHSKDGTDRVKVFETKGPSTTHSDLTFVTKPFEKLVNRAVDGVIEGTGKKVHSAEGEIRVETSRTERESGTGAGTLNIVSKTKRRAIEQKYDTSEL